MALVGVAGGFADQAVGPGDVVVASKIYAYEYGKIQGGRFHRRDTFDVTPDTSWLSFSKALSDPSALKSGNWTARIRVTKRPDKGQRRWTKVHVGPVASGEKVVDDPTHAFFAEARAALPDLYAIEMEGAGAGATIRNLQAERRIGFIMVRGISDVPRAEESASDQPRGTAQRDSWKPYAAAAAAAFLEYLLSHPGSPPPPDGEMAISGSPNVVEAPALDQARAAQAPVGLPLQPTSFVGREREIADALAVLRRQDVRLMTLTGPGGVGKTRLAVAVAGEAERDFVDGLAFVDLVPLSDAALVPPAVLHALGLREEGGQASTDRLREFLADKAVLLVVDNFEHVPAAAPLVASLLATCPGLKVVATSRKALRLTWEREFEVEPMTSDEAVALFEERARARRDDFAVTDDNRATIAEICARLDRLPLAIELAAVRTKALSPAAILRRLGQRLNLLAGGPLDADLRHRTLRAAIGWSYDLLSTDEQVLFRRLGVFVGGFLLEAVEAVARAANPIGVQAIDVIDALVDASLIRAEDDGDGELRYAMLETINEYAVEQLERSGEAPVVRRAHAEQLAEVARRLAKEVVDRGGGERPERVNRLEADQGNIRAALRWTENSGDDRLLVMLVGNLWRFWHVRGYASEGRLWLEKALAARLDLPADWRTDLLAGAGILAGSQGKYSEARALFEQAVETTANPRVVADLIFNMSVSAYYRDDFSEFERLLTASLQFFQESGDTAGIAKCLNALASAAQDRGDYSTAVRQLDECRRLLDSLGDRVDLQVLGSCIANRARAAHALGDFDKAEELFKASLEPKRLVGDRRGIAFSTLGRACVARDRGDRARAISLTEDSIRLFEEAEDESGRVNAALELGLLLLSDDPARAVQVLEDSLERLVGLGQRRGVANALDGLARALATVQPKRSARLYGGAEGLRQAMGIAISELERQVLDRQLQVVRVQLGAERFEEEESAGRTMSLEQLVAEARAAARALLAKDGT